MIASVGAFMLYFFILREENDIDEKIYQPIWKTVPELEIPLFEVAIQQHKQANMPYADLEAHLKQALQRQEEAQQQQKQAGGGSKN